MGSCYSCRSNGGLPTYTTVAMATTSGAELDPNTLAVVREKVGKTSSIRSVGSFGFRKRTPVSLTSQSKDRTSELVNLYETKISIMSYINNSRHSSLTSSNTLGSKGKVLTGSCFIAPSPVSSTESTFKSSVTNMSQSGINGDPESMIAGQNNQSYFGGGHVISDDNCNNISNVEHYNKLGRLSNRERFFLSSNSQITSTTKYECDFVRENKLGLQAPKIRPEDLKNGNFTDDKGDENSSANIQNETKKLQANSKLPCMVTTQISGLPRLQIPVIVNKVANRQPEAMQISADEIDVDDNHVLEGDSGLGNSLSDKRNEGDTETLAGVEQIEGDTSSISSRGNRRDSPDKTKLDKDLVTSIHPVADCHLKTMKPSGIARFKYSNPTAAPIQVVIPQTQSPKANALDRKFVLGEKSLKETFSTQQNQRKVLPPRKICVSSQVANKTQPNSIKPIVKKGVDTKKNGKGVYTTKAVTGKKTTVSGEWEKISELRQKENITPEVVEVVPINLPYTSKIEGISKLTSNYKSSRIESVLPSNVNETKDVKNSILSTDTQQRSLDHPFQEMGPYSPPSEKDFFLIDDEISDQPALIACQQYAGFIMNDIHSFKHVSKLSDMNEEGGLPAMAHVQSTRSPCQGRPSHSVDTISPCSSIDSEDLMLDFEKLDSGSQSRPLSEVFPERFQSPSDGKSTEHFLLAKLHSGRSKASTESIIINKTSGGSESASRRSSLSQKANWVSSTGSGVKTVDETSCEKYNIEPNHMLATENCLNNTTGSTYINSLKTSEDINHSTYRLLTQDITNVKTLLLRLKRVLQEADTANPLCCSTLKNGFIPRTIADSLSGTLGDAKVVAGLEQENTDLRRQAVYLKQQIEERDRTIRQLQQQLSLVNSPSTFDG